jgi:hypothetical protein
MARSRTVFIHGKVLQPTTASEFIAYIAVTYTEYECGVPHFLIPNSECYELQPPLNSLLTLL